MSTGYFDATAVMAREGARMQAQATIDQLTRERNEAVDKLNDGNRRDLDETRRLLIMALLRPRTERWYVLAATLVNALAHHGLGVPAEESMRHLTALCSADDAPDSVEWAQGLVARITATLGD